VSGPLRALQPLQCTPAQTRPQRRHFTQVLRTHHYLGMGRPVGENLGYLITSVHGQLLAGAWFGAPAWKVAARDAWIGWSAAQRQRALPWVAKHSRFLIVPKMSTYCYTSSVLGCQSNSDCCSTLGSDDPTWTFATAA